MNDSYLRQEIQALRASLQDINHLFGKLQTELFIAKSKLLVAEDFIKLNCTKEQIELYEKTTPQKEVSHP